MKDWEWPVEQLWSKTQAAILLGAPNQNRKAQIEQNHPLPRISPKSGWSGL